MTGVRSTTRDSNRAELLRNPICKITNINHTITQLKSSCVLCKKNEGKISSTGWAVTLPNFVLIFHSKRTVQSKSYICSLLFVVRTRRASQVHSHTALPRHHAFGLSLWLPLWVASHSLFGRNVVANDACCRVAIRRSIIAFSHTPPFDQ